MAEDEPLSRQDARPWTRIDEYVVGLARLRSARRRSLAIKPRTQPENPRFMLTTLPFMALMGGLLVLAAAVIFSAWPGDDQPPSRPAVEAREQGVAPRGWFADAEREFKR